MSDVDERELDDEEVEEREDNGEEGDEGAADGANGAPAAEEEELPDEKPFEGEAEVPLHVGAIGNATVRFNLNHDGAGGDAGTPLLPFWLRYVVADDVFYLQRVLSGRLKGPSKAIASLAADEEGGDEEGSPAGDAGGAAVPPAAGGADGDDEDGAGPTVSPNALFALVQTVAGSDIFTCVPYVPPPPADEDGLGEGEDQAAGGDPDAAAAGDAGEAGDDADGDEANADETAGAGAQGDAEPEEQPIEVIVDTLTLAALLSPSGCLPVLLGLPNVSVATAIEFAAPRFAIGQRQVIDALLNAISATPTATPRFPADFNWLIALHNNNAAGGHAPTGDDGSNAKPTPTTTSSKPGAPAGDHAKLRRVALDYMARLLASNIVPAAPISATHLRTSEAVNAYITLLLTMPRTQLIAWSKPRADDDDPGAAGAEVPEDAAEEAQAPTSAPVARFVVLALLDLRRRQARAAKGKAPLREPLSKSHKRTFDVLRAIGGGDKGCDTVAAPSFAARDYAPYHLQLRMSDLLLAALGRFAFAVESFETLLRMRMAVPRRAEAPVGFPALLFDSIATELCPEAIHVLVAEGDPHWFGPHGRVDIKRWAAQGLSENPASFDREVTLFAQRFGPHFLANEKLIGATDDSSEKLYNKLREIERFAESAAAEFCKPSGCDVHALDVALDRCGPAHICTPRMLQRAAAAGNREGVHWLVSRDVATVALPGTALTVGALEYAVLHLKDPELTLFLVELGADLNALWAGGRTSGTCAVQDLFSAAAAADILEAFRRKEAERLADPRCKVGLLHASAA